MFNNLALLSYFIKGYLINEILLFFPLDLLRKVLFKWPAKNKYMFIKIILISQKILTSFRIYIVKR